MAGYTVPQLVQFDDTFLVVEMTVVSPPFVLDFAGANLDSRRELEPELRAEWIAEKEEQFESDWKAVRLVIWQLENYGIYLNDIHPGNVRTR